MPPDPSTRCPIPGEPRTVFLNTVVRHPAIRIGDYTYYDDPDGAESFQEKNVLYLYDDTSDRLEIGTFCQIATGARFIMNGANHAMAGFSTYPFAAFGGDWVGRFDGELDGPE